MRYNLELGLAKELGDMLKKNEPTGCWNDDGVKRVNKSILDCQAVLGALSNLLQKSYVSLGIQM